jgi:hypothetical protein
MDDSDVQQMQKFEESMVALCMTASALSTLIFGSFPGKRHRDLWW